MPPIKTEPGVRIKSEHEARFDFSSIPRPPVPSAPVKQEDRKPDLPSFTSDGTLRRRRKFRHGNNAIVHRLRDGETIRAHYKQSEGIVDFTLSRGAAAIIYNFLEEGHRAEEMIFQRLRRANFSIQPTEPPGFLCRKGYVYLFGLLDVVSVKVEQISGHSRAPEVIAKQEQTKPESKPVAPTIPSFAEHIQHGHAKPPPLSTSSSGTSQPAAHIPQVPSDTPVFQKPSEGIFDMFRPKEQSKIVSHHIASENRPSPSLDSSSALTSGLFTGSGDQSTRSSRSVFSHSFSFSETKSPFPSTPPVPDKPAISSTNSSTTFSLFGPSAGPNLFGSPPAGPNLFVSPSAGPNPFAPSAGPNPFGSPPAGPNLFGSPPAGPNLFARPPAPHPRPFAQLPPPDAPVLAAAVKPAPEVIVIDSSPKSSRASSPQQPLPKKRAAETKARSD